MRRLLLRSSAALSLCAVAVSCGGGGDSLTAPSPLYPNVAGTWNVTATFDALPSSMAFVTGTFGFIQSSRFSGSISGLVNLTATINGQVFPITNYPFTGTVTTSGVTSFVLTEASGTTWSFTGTFAGNTVTGRHTLSGTTPISGDWSATRASPVAPRTVESAPAVGGLQNVFRALR